MIRDTTPDAAKLQWAALAEMSAEQRLRQALELTDFVLRVQAEGRARVAELRAAEQRPASSSERPGSP